MPIKKVVVVSLVVRSNPLRLWQDELKMEKKYPEMNFFSFTGRPFTRDSAIVLSAKYDDRRMATN